MQSLAQDTQKSIMKRALELESRVSMPKKVTSMASEVDLQNLNSKKEMKLPAMKSKEVRAFTSTPNPLDSKGDIEAKKKATAAILLFQCNICQCLPIPYKAAHIARHEAGKKHKKLQDLMEKKNILEAWGIVLIDESDVKYVCVPCDLKIEMSFKKMEQHFKAVYKLPPLTLATSTLEVTKVYCRKKFYKNSYDFDNDKVNFILVNGSISIQENAALSKNSIGILRKDVIPKSDIQELYGMASILEQLGRPIRRGKKKLGLKKVMYGIFEHCQLEWFVQQYPKLYALSEKFVKKMAHYFEATFLEVMANFEKIVANEGFNTMEGHFGGTPFTSFAITRDYSCLPHNDPKDYRFGIIVWLHPNGEVKKQPLFWLPEYKIHFYYGNGDAFICNAKTTMHCTTFPKPVGILGMAFVQYRSFIVQLSKALENPIGKLAVSYFEAKKRYIDDRDANRGKKAATIFY